MVQPVPKQMTREEKEKKVEFFREKIEGSPVVGILDMKNLPSRQLQEMKKEMKDFADIKMSRKTLMEFAIDQADKEGTEQLKENSATQPAFIFSEKDPFQLYKLIQDNKTSAAAQGGEEAPSDIEVSEGDTGIGPGPMLGKLQQAGLNVQVEDGSIHVQQSGVIVERGETITADDAEILNQLGIEPLEIGLDLDVVLSEGELFQAHELAIDAEEYRADIEAAATGAFNLAVNAGYITTRTAPTVVSNAAQKARNLSVNEGIPTKDTIEDILATASSRADSLDAQLDLEAAEVEEKESEEQDSESSGDDAAPAEEDSEGEEEEDEE
ncbi:MAG: 50S ribosomal protein L10 [Candidatus Nanohaloarchaea archaeon]